MSKMGKSSTVNGDSDRILRHPFKYDSHVPEIPFHRYIIDKMSHFNDRIAIVDVLTGVEWTFKQIIDATRRLAAALQIDFGLSKGQVVGLALTNGAEFIVSLLAVSICGAVAALINPGFTLGEFEHATNFTRPILWICTRKVLEMLPLKESDDIKAIYLPDDVDTINHLYKSWNYVLVSRNPEELKEITEFDVYNDLSTLPFSSGTTGLPKAVMLTHHNIVTLFCQYPAWSPHRDENDVTLGLLPMYHQFGWLMNMCSLSSGSKLINMARFSFSGMLRAIQDHKITILPIVPPIAVLLSKLIKTNYDLSSIRAIFMGAAPVSADVIESLQTKYSCRVKQAYGMTESTLCTHVSPQNTNHNNKPASVGIVMPFIDCKVVDKETGAQLGHGEVGEICIRGPMVMKGYLNNAEATTEALDAQSHWLRSGDLGYYDREGWFYIVGRLKELFKCKGFQVAPAELEHIILQHPEVEDAAVIGIPDEIAGHVPRAFVVKREGSCLTMTSVADFLQERVSPYKYLKGGVIFLKAIPKSASGKILRRELAARYSILVTDNQLEP